MSRTYRKKANKGKKHCYYRSFDNEQFSYYTVSTNYIIPDTLKLLQLRDQGYYKLVYDILKIDDFWKNPPFIFEYAASLRIYNQFHKKVFTENEIKPYLSEEDLAIILELGILKPTEKVKRIITPRLQSKPDEPFERFVIYKPKGNFKTFKENKALKCDRRNAGSKIVYKNADNFIFDICLCGCTNHERAWDTKEDFDNDPIDYMNEYERYFGHNNLNDMYQEDEKLILNIPKIRAKSVITPIWDDKCAVGIIKERRSRKFKKSIKYINSYID